MLLLVPLLSRLWGHNKLEVCRCISLTVHVTNVLSLKVWGFVGVPVSRTAVGPWCLQLSMCVPLPLLCPGRSSSMNPSLSATDRQKKLWLFFFFFTVSKRSCVQREGSTYCQRWNKHCSLLSMIKSKPGIPATLLKMPGINNVLCVTLHFPLWWRLQQRTELDRLQITPKYSSDFQCGFYDTVWSLKHLKFTRENYPGFVVAGC